MSEDEVGHSLDRHVQFTPDITMAQGAGVFNAG